MVNFGLLAAETCWWVWGTLVVGVSQTLRRWTEGATYIRQGGHHVGHWPTFLVMSGIHYYLCSQWISIWGSNSLARVSKTGTPICKYTEEDKFPKIFKSIYEASTTAVIRVYMFLVSSFSDNKTVVLLIMASLCYGAGHYIFVLWFLLYLSSFFFFFA